MVFNGMDFAVYIQYTQGSLDRGQGYVSKAVMVALQPMSDGCDAHVDAGYRCPSTRRVRQAQNNHEIARQ